MNSVPCECREEEAENGSRVTIQCRYCDALDLLGLTRSDVENIPLLHECNKALAERGVRLSNQLEFARMKEHEARRCSYSDVVRRREAVYALRHLGFDETDVPRLAREYEKSKEKS
jgi:hypothetical protein